MGSKIFWHGPIAIISKNLMGNQFWNSERLPNWPPPGYANGRGIKINHIAFARGETALSFAKNVFFQRLSIEVKYGSTFCAITFALYVMLN